MDEEGEEGEEKEEEIKIQKQLTRSCSTRGERREKHIHSLFIWQEKDNKPTIIDITLSSNEQPSVIIRFATSIHISVHTSRLERGLIVTREGEDDNCCLSRRCC